MALIRRGDFGLCVFGVKTSNQYLSRVFSSSGVNTITARLRNIEAILHSGDPTQTPGSIISVMYSRLQKTRLKIILVYKQFMN